MRRMMRTAAAALVAIAVGALPTVLDRCADTCEMHKRGPAAPSCHHAASTATHIGAAPVSCGHDHHEVVSTIAARIVTNDSGPAVTATIAVAHHPIAGLAHADRSPIESPPPYIVTSIQSVLPLRV